MISIVSVLEGSSSSGGKKEPRIPLAIERIVRRQNLDFMHNKNQFCPEYFGYIRKLLGCNINSLITHIQRDMKMVGILNISKLSLVFPFYAKHCAGVIC